MIKERNIDIRLTFLAVQIESLRLVKDGCYEKITFILDLECENASGILQEANSSFDTEESYSNELRHKEIRTFEKYHTQLFLLLVQMHNFRYSKTFTSPWFGNTTSGVDGGIAKLLYEESIDITSAGGNLRIGRVKYLDYFAVTMRFRSRFFFRNPGMKKIGVDILKPFSRKTWYVTLTTMLILSIALKLTYWIDNTFLNSNIRQSLFTSFVVIISIFSQQGSSTVPYRLGGRLIFLTVLVLSILMYNYYTSSLVSSLLGTKPPALKTIKELYESTLKVGIEDEAYTITHIIQEKDDYYVQQLNRTKIYDPHPNFPTPKEGLRRVKQGGFAYHMQVTTAYPMISRLFDQEEICDLAQIDFVPPGYMSLIVPKKSQYRELFQIRYC
ncbi:hypothetical protein NQ317_002282 [Molorchus minor]|uniref:Ionotropic glutamate receptor C-terminal domain-containing protein n=1 Tax=Molorchus minor TaxID=1323400 RepID=A0ABQ9JKT8_9CUCU|nr:hypothetical protein NQ317_002282 [Molorchus minor]